MDPSAELLQLLREIRDNERELLVMMKAWEDRSDKRYAEEKKDRENWIMKQEGDRLQWREANDLYLRQHRLGRRAGIVMVILLVLGIATGIAIAIMG